MYKIYIISSITVNVFFSATTVTLKTGRFAIYILRNMYVVREY